MKLVHVYNVHYLHICHQWKGKPSGRWQFATRHLLLGVMKDCCAFETWATTQMTHRSLASSASPLWEPQILRYHKWFIVLWWPDNFLAVLPNSVDSCSRHRVFAARLTSEWAASITRLSKIYSLLGIHSQLQWLWTLLKWRENTWCSIRSASTFTSLPLHPKIKN
jgi:hypothetical protein